MSYIPNCRPKYKKEAGPFPYIKTEDIPQTEINPYWYGLLKGKDKSFLQGYDWNVEQVINNLFDNLTVYENKLEEIGIYASDIDPNIVNGSNRFDNITMKHSSSPREYKGYDEYNEDELDCMNESTRIMLLIKTILNDWIEMERDMLVTSMIENMDESKHSAAVTEAFMSERKRETKSSKKTDSIRG